MDKKYKYPDWIYDPDFLGIPNDLESSSDCCKFLCKYGDSNKGCSLNDLCKCKYNEYYGEEDSNT